VWPSVAIPIGEATRSRKLAGNDEVAEAVEAVSLSAGRATCEEHPAATSAATAASAAAHARLLGRGRAEARTAAEPSVPNAAAGCG
jgi:hypothetical protein